MLGAAATSALIGAFALIAVITAFHQGRFVPTYALTVLAGLVIAATLPWWRRESGGRAHVFPWNDLLHRSPMGKLTEHDLSFLELATQNHNNS